MIDFHSHILPRLDDGSKSSDMSLQMLRASAEYDIDVMVATPHFYIHSSSADRFLKQRQASYEALMRKAALCDAALPEIRLGAEVYYFGNMSSFPEIKKLCIDGTNHLLLELPFGEWTGKIIADTEKLIYDAGIVPIIAHLDRYISLQKGNTYIKDLLNMGVLIQLNADYIIGLLSRSKALKLIKGGVVNLLGSDCHNMDRRAPNLGKAFRIIRQSCGQEALDRIDACGREILGL